MNAKNCVVEEVKGFYKILPLTRFRHTPGVSFDYVPRDLFPHIDGIDRVIHAGGAVSPGPVGSVKRPWYMHPYQEDHLVVFHGVRCVALYSKEYKRIETFEVSAHEIKKNGKKVLSCAAMLAWPCFVFHRVQSSSKTGSASMNFAVRHSGFDIKTNFNIYDLNPEDGSCRVIREGHLDQNA